MTKQEMIDKIYEEIADKIIKTGVLFKYKNSVYQAIMTRKDEFAEGTHILGWYINYKGEVNYINSSKVEIIGHPVMINRIEYILDKDDYRDIRNLLSKEELILPVDDWSEKAIQTLYLKIKDNV